LREFGDDFSAESLRFFCPRVVNIAVELMRFASLILDDLVASSFREQV
jgi:hypothetical protein